MKSTFICIEGNLGAGKTTLAKALSKKLGATLLLETFENNPFLEDLYRQKEGSQLPTELFFLMERFDQLAQNNFSKHNLIIADYILDKSNLFSKINLTSIEWNLFNRVFERVKKETANPHALIFIEQTPEEAMNNIRLRGREIETPVQLDYLEKVHSAYQGYVNLTEHPFPILRISSSELRDNLNDTMQKTIDFLVKERLLVV